MKTHSSLHVSLTQVVVAPVGPYTTSLPVTISRRVASTLLRTDTNYGITLSPYTNNQTTPATCIVGIFDEGLLAIFSRAFSPVSLFLLFFGSFDVKK